MNGANRNINNWGFAFLLALPVFYLYGLHFLYHDAAHTPTGFIQWEHILYMCSAKEYVTGSAFILYQWPILNTYTDGAVFFQPQIFVLGYLWKWLEVDPGYLITLFGLIFTVLTLKTVVSIIDMIIPSGRYKKLIAVLFCWGGGILSLCGILLHFTFFKGSLAGLHEHIFFLDPSNGSWCLNFGRTLIYPLEAYYHFLFVSCILLVLKRKFIATFLLMLLLILSHPYTAIEIITIILGWLVAEYFYIKNTTIKRKDLILVAVAFCLYFLYYGVILNRIEIYRAINQLNTLNWNYRAWHFIPAYALVWLFSLLAVKNIPALKKRFSDSNQRLFFSWGMIAFLLSVHDLVLKPIQPIHFARGYVYAGFFLFCTPFLLQLFEKWSLQKTKGLLILSFVTILFLFDNISWFGYALAEKNQAGVYFTKEENELIGFFKKEKQQGIVIGSEKNYELNAAIQLYSQQKSWIPHPFLSFDIAAKRAAMDTLLSNGTIDPQWKTVPCYLQYDKNDSILQIPGYQPVFENNRYRVLKIN